MGQKLPNGYWRQRGVVRSAISSLARQLKKSPQAMTWRDLESNGLSGLIQHHGTIAAALAFAGIRLDVGARVKHPPALWRDRNRRAEAVKLVLRRTGKDFSQLQRRDFLKCGVGGLLRGDRTIYSVCKDAGFKGEPWELGRVPNGYFELRKNRVRAVQWLARQSKKDLATLTKEDFYARGLGRLITRRPGGVPEVLWEAGGPDPAMGARKRWSNRQAVEAALQRVLVATKKKSLDEVSADDLKDNGLAGLYQKFKNLGALMAFVGVRRNGKPNPYRSSAMKWVSDHGHRFKSKAERDFDGMLAGLLGLSRDEHAHDVPYAPGRMYTADFVSKKHGVAFEYFGWHFMPGRRDSRRQAEYRAHERAKMAMARKFNRPLVGVIPNGDREWIIRASHPLRDIWRRLGLA